LILFQWISGCGATIYLALAHNGFIDDDRPEQGTLPNKFCSLFFVISEPPGVFPGLKKK